MKNRELLLILVSVALVLVCCIGLSNVTLRAIVAQPTSTPAPTDTPTPTPTPTSTDTPTPEPAAGPSLQIQRYSLEIKRKDEALSQTRQELGELLEAPQLTDRDWKREVAVHVATIDRICQELTDMEVPVEMIGVHSALLDATFDCEGVMFFLKDVDDMSLSDVRVASRLMASCSEKFSRHAQVFEEYMR